ncbi:stage III sporulation protein AG [Clostridium sp. Mt-5]|uniref:Stage III sporulation protein AG n=1 Tax=Clostridium moutaii TaxID=3240932 RepID=A0ABV4BKX4_9CLOT
MNFKKWLNKIIKDNNHKIYTDKKNIVNLAIVFLVGILIVAAVSLFKDYGKNTSSNYISSDNVQNSNSQQSKVQSQTSQDSSSDNYEKSTQENLKSTLEQIDGVGKVEVMISFESGEEHVPAVNINDSTNTTEEKDNTGGTRNSTQQNNGSTVVTTNDGSKSEPLILKTYNPKVLGVCIVAEGAENKITELRISKAVTDLFGISEDKVNVYPMKK